MPPPFVTAASARVDARIASATRLPIAASRVRTVAVRLSSATAVVPSAASSSLLSSPSYLATTAATSGSGVVSSVMSGSGGAVAARRVHSREYDRALGGRGSAKGSVTGGAEDANAAAAHKDSVAM